METCFLFFRFLIEFIEGKEPMWRGYMYAVGMFVCASVQSLLWGQYSMTVCRVGVRIKSALSSMVYKKALSLSNEARKKCTVGEIINLMSTDVNRYLFYSF